jgi:hypothetical protein
MQKFQQSKYFYAIFISGSGKKKIYIRKPEAKSFRRASNIKATTHTFLPNYTPLENTKTTDELTGVQLSSFQQHSAQTTFT